MSPHLRSRHFFDVARRVGEVLRIRRRRLPFPHGVLDPLRLDPDHLIRQRVHLAREVRGRRDAEHQPDRQPLMRVDVVRL